MVALSAERNQPGGNRPIITVVPAAVPADEASDRLAAAQAQANAMVTVYEPKVLSADDQTVTASAGALATRRLVEVAQWAHARGIRRVIWPANAGADAPDGGVLDRVAGIIDRAALVSRLVSMDDDRAGTDCGVEIETPYADLSDREIAELMLDLDAPVWTCWWAMGTGPRAAMEREHWRGILRDLGWTGPLPRGEAKPLDPSATANPARFVG
ncbi:MAG: hypothetical protein ACKVW3_00385 [Phycisphaerales bacterium]